MTVTQGGTQISDLANGLPCSSQLSPPYNPYLCKSEICTYLNFGMQSMNCGKHYHLLQHTLSSV